jgi:hypothetical protein
MSRYLIPTHLQHEAPLIPASAYLPLDLSFRQAALLASAVAVAYWAWQASGWPWPLALALSLLALTLAGLAAFVTVGGRTADLWLRDWLRFQARPRRRTWQAVTAPLTTTAPGHWVDQPLQLAWATSPDDDRPADAA